LLPLVFEDCLCASSTPVQYSSPMPSTRVWFYRSLWVHLPHVDVDNGLDALILLSTYKAPVPVNVSNGLKLVNCSHTSQGPVVPLSTKFLFVIVTFITDNVEPMFAPLALASHLIHSHSFPVGPFEGHPEHCAQNTVD
jgi:hypothetical protein